MNKNTAIQLIFGGIIFLFGTALGYFTASYLERNGTFGYDNALLIFGGAYLVIGIVLMKVFPVSLGFLFSADVFLLHVMGKDYRGYENLLKALITGIIIVLLYLFAYWKLRDRADKPAQLN